MTPEMQNSPAPRLESQTAQRVFFDTAGQRWRVYEALQPAFDRRGGACLVFASDEVIRRVRSYPANWRQLSDAELMALSWNR